MNTETDWQRECCVCYKRIAEDVCITCDKCRAVIYCCRKCHDDDMGQDDGENNRSHVKWCPLYKRFMEREPELSDFPFTFAKETTDLLFHEHHLVSFLQRHGVYGKGMWRRESPRMHKPHARKKCGHFTSADEDKWVLPDETSILRSSASPGILSLSSPLTDWQQYYSFRGLPLHSPVAAILSYPMTVYYILTTCLEREESEIFTRLEDTIPLQIHLLGVEKEVEMKEAFLECARLLPTCKLHITMVGQNIAKSIDKFHWEKENLSLTVLRGLYHEMGLPPPHLAVGLNAGLPAYATWPHTLQMLKAHRTPAYFTDQCEYSCECVSSSISAHGIPSISPVTVNPFRSPLRIVTRELNMPWFPNAFLFRLVYDDDVEK